MFCRFHCHPKGIQCYTAQPEPAAFDPKCTPILQSDMKETVVNESSTRGFEKKCPFCKKSQWKVNQKQQPLIYCTIESCADSMKNIITNSDDQKLVYEYGNIDFLSQEVCYHHKCRLEFTYQVSKSKSQDTAILKDKVTPTHFHTLKHLALMDLNRNPLLFPFKESFGTSAQTKI